MKRILILGALVLGLVACGGTSTPGNSGSGSTGGSTGGNTGGSTGGGSTGSATYPYNPDASATEATDTRIPYRGDWIWAAKLSDGSYKLGVLVVSTRGKEQTYAKNGGTGLNAPCTDETCTNIDVGSYSFGLLYTQLSDSGQPQPKLAALLGDPASTTTSRVSMVDSDGKVATNAEGHAVVSGRGTAGMQAAGVAFVQINSDENKEGVIDVTVLADAVAQAKAAADQVPAPAAQAQALPRLDGKSMLR